MMVIAIANPLCCCTADVFAMDEAMPMQSSSACCSSQVGHDESQPTAPAHDTENCPHQASKEFQSLSGSQQDVKTLQAHPDLLPVLAYLFETYELRPQLVSHARVSVLTASIAAPPELSQVYCVYRI